MFSGFDILHVFRRVFFFKHYFFHLFLGHTVAMFVCVQVLRDAYDAWIETDH